MNDRMTPMPFPQLMQWMVTERDAIFGIRQPFHATAGKALPLFGGTMEIPCGPAAGPHTQLSQNIVAAYVAGARFFELKTVQTLDGEDLPVAKPCISAGDEGYNVEWSTELTVPQAFDEYVKAWFAIKLLSRELALGGEDGFLFNMSVGYDLAGIGSEKIDRFIEGLKDASSSSIWRECTEWTLAHLDLFEKIDEGYVRGISPRVCASITLSTLHGCPPAEIERIATYLLEEKRLHTFVKLNPTLLGYDFARACMDEMGYGYLVFDDHHFRNDLQYADAVPMLTRLQARADALGLTFGVKLTNTFPVRIAAGELPGEEMYMSGRPLFALATALAVKLSRTFEGKLRISYSGGADASNIASLFSAGIYPVTVATTLLKPGGYQRLSQMAQVLARLPYAPFAGVDVEAVESIAKAARSDGRYTKPLKALPSRKGSDAVPLLDCFDAPCAAGCPIHQDIPEYIRLMGEGKPLEALRVITQDNPLPFITGTLCNHRCQDKCRRNFYEENVHIRKVKLEAATQGMKTLMAEITAPQKDGAKVAVVGGGAAGMSAAYFLARAGMDVTLFEKEDALGGVVRHVIPPFRIAQEAIDQDIALMQAMGVTVQLGKAITDLNALRAQGFGYIVLGIGASVHGNLTVGDKPAINAIAFLRQFRQGAEALHLGEHVAVIGAGNTAMDTARAAMRVPGVKSVTIVYRRDMRNMPADQEELAMALADGVRFQALLAPVAHQAGALRCENMALGQPDATGRCSPVSMGTYTDLPADTVITAIGERIDEAFYAQVGVDENTFIIGDGKRGPATVVEAIADARCAADEILRREGRLGSQPQHTPADAKAAANKKGWLMPFTKTANEAYRCLECDVICECCVDVCPNRANVTLQVQGRAQIIHLDRLCNACGNCETFCPYASAPYKDKFTLFSTEKDYHDSQAQGVFIRNAEGGDVLLRANEDMTAVVHALLTDYRYML